VDIELSRVSKIEGRFFEMNVVLKGAGKLRGGDSDAELSLPHRIM